MLYQLHRFKLIMALSLTLAAVAAAPAAGMFAGPLGPQPVPPSTQSTVCSEVCSGGGYARTGSAVVALNKHQVKPLIGHRGTSVQLVRHSDGFAWGDAGIGAGAAIALLAIILGVVGAAASRRGHRLGRSTATAAG